MEAIVTDKGRILILCLTAFFLLLGCLDLPYGYYSFLRIVVFLSCVVQVYIGRGEGLSSVNIMLAVVAIVFNPFIPLHLGVRVVWTVIDLATGVWFAAMAWRRYRALRSE